HKRTFLCSVPRQSENSYDPTRSRPPTHTSYDGSSHRRAKRGYERRTPSLQYLRHPSPTPSLGGPQPHMHQANTHTSWKLGLNGGFAHHEDIPYDVLCVYHIIEKSYPHLDKPRP